MNEFLEVGVCGLWSIARYLTVRRWRRKRLTEKFKKCEPGRFGPEIGLK
jgi:hypothetical protein